MTEMLTESYRGSNKIKAGKGNKGLVIDFATAKLTRFGKHPLRRLNTCRGFSQAQGRAQGAAMQGPRSGCKVSRLSCPAGSAPCLQGRKSLGRAIGQQDIPQGIQDGPHSGPTP